MNHNVDVKQMAETMMGNGFERKPGGKVRPMKPYDPDKKKNSPHRPESYAQLYRVSVNFIYTDTTKGIEKKDFEVVAYGMKNAIAAVNEEAMRVGAHAAGVDVNLVRRLPFQGHLIVTNNGYSANNYLTGEQVQDDR